MIRQYSIVLLLLIFLALPAGASLLDGVSIGVGGETEEQSYDSMVDAFFANGKTATIVDNKLWVPWFRTSSSCSLGDLQSGKSCNAGEINFDKNCMVTDEFSQVGIIVSMGKDQKRMDAFYNTVVAIKSTNGEIPAWRVYRNGNNIEQCKQGINGNCDTASDATARIIISLFTASKNPEFSKEARDRYFKKGKSISEDFLKYEVVQECRQTDFGKVCNWLAAGSDAKRGGLSSNDFTYTGYFGDAAIAMLQACSLTGDQKYCQAAKDFIFNYLQASGWDGTHFSVPPGRSFKWNSKMEAECTGNCGEWDGYDAPRALGICSALYYADAMDFELLGLKSYCSQWGDKHLSNPSRAVLQYYPDGSTGHAAQKGYFAQGLQSLFALGYDRKLFQDALESALSHYSPSTKTWDNSACFGIYTTAFAIRGLGTGLGRDIASFSPIGSPIGMPNEGVADPQYPIGGQAPSGPASPDSGSNEGKKSALASLPAYCEPSCQIKSDSTSGSCRTVTFTSSNNEIMVMTCEKENDFAELYRQTPIKNVKACIGKACVDALKGFERFQLPAKQDIPQVPSLSLVTSPEQEEPQANLHPAFKPLSELPVTCSGSKCRIKSDKMDGSCREFKVKTDVGTVKVKACEDGSKVKVYRKSRPSEPFRVCLGGGCIDRSTRTAEFMISNEDDEDNSQDNLPANQEGDQENKEEAKPVMSLPVSFSNSAAKSRDMIESSGCRLVEYSSSAGANTARICPKENKRYEMYLLSQKIQGDICVSSHCVGSRSGFASFTV